MELAFGGVCYFWCSRRNWRCFQVANNYCELGRPDEPASRIHRDGRSGLRGAPFNHKSITSMLTA